MTNKYDTYEKIITAGMISISAGFLTAGIGAMEKDLDTVAAGLFTSFLGVCICTAARVTQKLQTKGAHDINITLPRSRNEANPPSYVLKVDEEGLHLQENNFIDEPDLLSESRAIPINNTIAQTQV